MSRNPERRSLPAFSPADQAARIPASQGTEGRSRRSGSGQEGGGVPGEGIRTGAGRGRFGPGRRQAPSPERREDPERAARGRLHRVGREEDVGGEQPRLEPVGPQRRDRLRVPGEERRLPYLVGVDRVRSRLAGEVDQRLDGWAPPKDETASPGFERLRKRLKGIVEEDARGAARGGIPFLPRGVHPRGDDRPPARDRRLESRVVRKAQVPPEPDDGRRGYTLHWLSIPERLPESPRGATESAGGQEGTALKVLVLNSGSSSIKYRLFGMESMAVLRAGVVDRIGEPGPSRGPGSPGRVRAGDGRSLGLGSDRGTGRPLRHRAPGRPRRRAVPGTGAGGSPGPSMRSGR